jgi:hypothetical protein
MAENTSHCKISCEGFSAMWRIFCSVKNTMPCEGYASMSRIFRHVKDFLSREGNYTVWWNFCYVNSRGKHQRYVRIIKSRSRRISCFCIKSGQGSNNFLIDMSYI